MYKEKGLGRIFRVKQVIYVQGAMDDLSSKLYKNENDISF